MYARLAGVPVDAEAIRESMAFLAASGISHQFRTTWVPPFLTDGDLAEIRALVPRGSSWQT